MSSRDYLFQAAKNYLNRQIEGFQDEAGEEGRSWFATIMLALLFIVALGLYAYASYLVFTCKGLQMWIRILIFISFHILPIIGPLGFIIFSYFSPICAAVVTVATQVAAQVPAVATGAITAAVTQPMVEIQPVVEVVEG